MDHPIGTAWAMIFCVEHNLLLAQFPEGYRHLGYLQSKNGHNVKKGLPGLRGEAVQTLYAEGRAWLAGSPTPGVPL